MSKILNIGAYYVPNVKVVDANGQTNLVPYVYFYFNCDSRTANIVAGSGVAKGLDVDGDALVRGVPADDYKKFIYGKKAFPNILSELERVGGYVYDTNNLGQLEAQVEKSINDVKTSALASKLQVDRGSYIDDILEALEKNINDPKFMDYLNTIGAIKKFDTSDYEKIVSFSALNNAMILTQWLKHGKQQPPRFMATAAQWQNFNRQPIQNAIPVYTVRPAGTQKAGKNAVMNKFGISNSDYNNDAMARHFVRKGMYDINYGEANNNDGSFMVDGPYYDISETELIPGKQDVYDFYNTSDSVNTNINPDAKKDDDAARFDFLKPDDSKSNYDARTLIKNVYDFAVKNNDADLEKVASSNNIGRVIDYLVENSDTIARLRGKGYKGWNSNVQAERDKKALYASLTKALLYLRFGLDSSVAQKIIGENMKNIRTRSGGFNKAAFNAIMSDFQNIYFIMAGINEGIEDNLFMWGLNALGISVEEYKNMPNTEEEALAELNGVRENFIRNFNMLLK